MLTIDRHPPDRQLRSFGMLLAIFVPLLGAMFWWRTGRLNVGVTVWAVGGVLTAVYWLLPALRRTVYVGWMYAAFPIGWTVSHLLMAIIFYGAITPIGWVLRVSGRELLPRRFDRAARTYWVPRVRNDDIGRYFRQY